MDYEKALSDAYEKGYNAGLKDNGDYAVLGEVLAELMEEVEKENKEEGICGVRFNNSDGEERRIEDINYGYELRFKKILGKYFA